MIPIWDYGWVDFFSFRELQTIGFVLVFVDWKDVTAKQRRHVNGHAYIFIMDSRFPQTATLIVISD